MSKTIYPSRWGYHPCSYSQYSFLRFLRKRIYEELKAIGRFNRWHRKTKVANRHGPEPLANPAYVEAEMVYCYSVWDKETKGITKKIYTKRARLIEGFSIKNLDELFRLARTPLPTPEMAQAVDEVNSLNHAIEELKRMELTVNSACG